MTVNERIKQVRKTLKLSQVEFAKAICISNGYIAELENNHRRVNNRIIHLISLTFGVNETWLKNGQGDMFYNTAEDKQRRLISLFAELPPQFQDYITTQIETLLALTREH